ncbi:MAG: hypothetical protein AB8B91_06935 [Rubripirellula sp.]
MTSKKHLRILTILFLATCSSQLGCVALNIPSQRFQDAQDHGGVLGHWRNHGHLATPTGTGHNHHHDGEACSFDGGPLEVDPFDPSLDASSNPKQPEVPWPRFHPVPTRPVFGGSAS